MIRSRWVARMVQGAMPLAVVLASAIAGCDKPTPRASRAVSPATRPATRPTTQPTPLTQATTRPAAPQPTTAPQQQAVATTEPAVSFLVIDGQLVEFPAAKVILVRKNGKLKARLFSDNPKSALEETYAGNSFYFDMPLEPDAEQPGQWVWRFKSPDSEASDSPNGIYLNGLRTHLQPFDVLVQMDGNSLKANVRVLPPSQFRAFEKGAAENNSVLVVVSGNLVADVVAK